MTSVQEQRDSRSAEIVADVKNGLVSASRKPLPIDRAQRRRAGLVDRPFGKGRAHGIEREQHAARDIDDVDRKAGHRQRPSWRVRPAKRSAATINTIVNAISTPDTAAVRTSRSFSMICHMWIGNTSVRASARKSETGTLSNDAMNAMNAPAPIPLPISGNVMRRNVIDGGAPRLSDASTNPGSSCASEAIVVRIT